MIIPQFDQDLATMKAFQIQWANGYHFSEKDLKEFNESMERLKEFQILVSGKNTSL